MLHEHELSQFCGTMEYHRFNNLMRRCVLTDGALHVAREAGAFWLMDAIGSYQFQLLKNHQWAREIQFWHLELNKDGSATLTCKRDSGYKPAITQEIPHTNFPFSIDIWVQYSDDIGSVFMLKSEY